MFLLLQPDAEGEQTSQLSQPFFRHVIVEATALANQVGHIGGVFLVVLVPAAIEKLAVFATATFET
jgi:hypothetical protein